LALRKVNGIIFGSEESPEELQANKNPVSMIRELIIEKKENFKLIQAKITSFKRNFVNCAKK
jgi:hypothetical protein